MKLSSCDSSTQKAHLVRVQACACVCVSVSPTPTYCWQHGMGGAVEPELPWQLSSGEASRAPTAQIPAQNSAQKRPPSRPGLSKSRDHGQLLTAPKASSWRFYKALFLPTLPSILSTLKTVNMLHPQTLNAHLLSSSRVEEMHKVAQLWLLPWQ